MEKITAGITETYMDAVVIGPAGLILAVLFYDRSFQTVRSFGATVMEGGRVELIIENRKVDRFFTNQKKIQVFYNPVTSGKERFYHGIAVAEDIQKDYLITTREELYEDMYNFLMNNFHLPLLKEWMPQIRHALGNRMSSGNGLHVIGNEDIQITRKGKSVRVSDLVAFAMNFDEEILKQNVAMLLKDKRIRISQGNAPMKPLCFRNLDEYFAKYGKTIVENLQRQLKPVSDFNPVITEAALNTKRLYPQQAAMVNGVHEFLKRKKKGYILFCMGTGTGKTIQASTAAEMLHVSQFIQQTAGTLEKAYEKDGVINYRHIVMCPPIMVNKWKRELEHEIPYAKVEIIDTFRQLVALREAGPERCHGKEIYVISKDFAKLSYQRMPVTGQEASKYVEVRCCANPSCNSEVRGDTRECPLCRGDKFVTRKTHFVRRGLTCHACGRLLFPAKEIPMSIELVDDDERQIQPLQWWDFTSERDGNQRCGYCGEYLWQPYVKRIHAAFGEESKPFKWKRMTFWANKTHKGTSTKWVLRGKENEAMNMYGPVLNEIDNEGGARKYSPAQYIKKYLKGYFDVYIADEIHKSKGGSTAQGNAFHSIAKSSRYVFGLTGTIAGGVASDLFYLLFRLDPKRMIERGYDYSSIQKFSREYGVVEESYERREDLARNTASRGRRIGLPRTLPGISPRVFSEFLLDHAVFLEIPDMSASMPPLKEYIVLSKPEEGLEVEMVHYVESVVRTLQQYARDMKVNLSPVLNQFKVAYLDHPYGHSPIRNPKTGEILENLRDYQKLILDGRMLTKEKDMIDKIKEELANGRNCVVYAEYTQDDETNVLPRLEKLIREECGLKKNEVVVMTSQKPQATKREEWMHRKAREGMKVMLCNPRLVEVGLDFCWEDEDGKIYNYPNLFFFQAGYSLLVVWQAAGRAWRLNQREECHTYYMGWEGTVQQAILQVLGEKKAATAAIQGHFSAAGLAAMARGVDTQVRIAQIMAEMDEAADGKSKLQSMFDVITQKADEEYVGTEKMKTFAEIVGKVAEKVKSDDGLAKRVAALDEDYLFSLFDELLGASEEKPQSEMVTQNQEASIDDIFRDFLKRSEEIEIPRSKSRKRLRKPFNEIEEFGFVQTVY